MYFAGRRFHGNGRTNLQHVCAEHLAAVPVKVVRVILHERRPARQVGGHGFHRPHQGGSFHCRPIRYLTNAAVDASGERPLAVYRSGRSVIHTWNNFNSGDYGYTKRCDAVDTALAGPDRDLPDVTVERIRQAIVDLVRHWYNDRDLAESALRLMIGRRDDTAEAIYRTHWGSTGFDLEFTDAGREWLKKRLGQTNFTADETYGHRVRRILYDQPSGAAPRMVSPTT